LQLGPRRRLDLSEAALFARAVGGK